MKSILETLDASAIETLLSWCEDHPYTEVKKLAARPPSEGGLGLQISASTLCRLYTSHGIADSKEARARYAASLGLDTNKTILDAAQDQLELRVLELSSRPNPSVAELRLLSQIVTRLRSLQLGERRVQVAEKRKTRMATPPPQPEKPKLLSPAEIKHRIRVFLGKEQPRDFDETDGADPRPSSGPPNPHNSRTDIIMIARLAPKILSFSPRLLPARDCAIQGFMTSTNRMFLWLARVSLVTALAPLFIVTALADGCFVFKWNKNIDINEPTQKAIIVYDQGREDLLLQVKYEGPLQEFGWLVPVPSEPKVERGSMDAFYELSQLTQMHFGSPSTGAATMSDSPGSAGPDPAVKVIQTKTVGAYEISILSATDADALQSWLHSNGYSLPDGKTEIINEYIHKGWSFVAAKIHLNGGAAFRLVTSQKESAAATPSRIVIGKKLASGELHPLLISFDTAKCVFPLKISAVADKPSEVSLYVISKKPLLNRFLFDEATRKLEQEYTEWENHKKERADLPRQSAQNLRMLMLSQMLYRGDRGPNSPRARPGAPRPRDWSNEDLQAMAAETAPPEPHSTIDDEYFFPQVQLLQCLRAEAAQLKKSAQSLPRLKGKTWYVTKFSRSFKSSEMRDLEFEPAAPALTEILTRPIGASAANILAVSGPEEVAVLLAAAKSKDSTVRLNAAEGFQLLRDARVVDSLIALLKDESPKVRLLAARIAGSNADPKLKPAMEALLRDAHPEIRAEAIQYLGTFDRDQPAKYLKLLNDPNRDFQLAALDVLARVNRDAIPAQALIHLVRDPDPEIRHGALLIAQHTPDLIPRPDLLPMLSSTNLMDLGIAKMLIERKSPLTSSELAVLTTNHLSHVRLMSLRLLQRKADATAVELILSMLHDTNSVVRSRAFSTIKAMTAENVSDNDPAKWETWWKANKDAALATKASP